MSLTPAIDITASSAQQHCGFFLFLALRQSATLLAEKLIIKNDHTHTLLCRIPCLRNLTKHCKLVLWWEKRICELSICASADNSRDSVMIIFRMMFNVLSLSFSPSLPLQDQDDKGRCSLRQGHLLVRICNFSFSAKRTLRFLSPPPSSFLSTSSNSFSSNRFWGGGRGVWWRWRKRGNWNGP